MSNIYTDAELRAAFGRADAKVRAGIEVGVTRLLEFTANEARRLVRVKQKKQRAVGAGSSLLKNIGTGSQGVKQVTKEPGAVLGVVGTKIPHGTYLEFGTGIYGPKGKVIKPTSKQALFWIEAAGTGKASGMSATGRATKHTYRKFGWHWAKWVRGVPPWRWLSGAHLSMRGRTLGVLKKALNEVGV